MRGETGFHLGFKEVSVVFLLREGDCFVDAIIRSAGTVVTVPIDPKTETDQTDKPEKIDLLTRD